MHAAYVFVTLKCLQLWMLRLRLCLIATFVSVINCCKQLLQLRLLRPTLYDTGFNDFEEKRMVSVSVSKTLQERFTEMISHCYSITGNGVVSFISQSMPH